MCMLSLVMYRYSPIWYSERLPEVLHGYSQILSSGKPPNLHLLSGFPTPEYNKEGEYMTTFSRLEFLLHLFEGAEAAIKDFAPSPVEVLLQQYESNRALANRVMVLEQGQCRLDPSSKKDCCRS